MSRRRTVEVGVARVRGRGDRRPEQVRARWGRRAGERGSGTVLLLGVVAAVLALLVGMSMLIRAEQARASAQTAADLAALAAATRLTMVSATPVSGSACALAREVAARNGARLTVCGTAPGGVARVTVTRGVGVGTAAASARAGPAETRARPRGEPGGVVP